MVVHAGASTDKFNIRLHGYLTFKSDAFDTSMGGDVSSSKASKRMRGVDAPADARQKFCVCGRAV